MSQRCVYRCLRSVVWAKDAQQTLVVDKESHRSWTLHGTEAVIWDLLTVGYAYRELVATLALLLSLPTEEAAGTLTDVLQTWRDAGIVHVGQEADGG